MINKLEQNKPFNDSLKVWYMCLVVDSIRLLDAVLLSSLMYNETDVLFTVTGVVIVCCCH